MAGAGTASLNGDGGGLGGSAGGRWRRRLTEPRRMASARTEDEDGRTADDDERRGPNLLHLCLPSDGGTAAGEAEVERVAGHRGLKLRLCMRMANDG